MTIAIASTGAGALVALGGASRSPVEPVQPVTADKPTPDRRFDAGAGRSRSGGVAAMLLQWGGTPNPDTAAASEPEVTASKPNLDALERVLAHYSAQSEAAARLGR